MCLYVKLVYSIQNNGTVDCVLCKNLSGSSKLTTWPSWLSKISLRKKCMWALTHIHTHKSRKCGSRKTRWIKSLTCKCKFLLWFAARLLFFSVIINDTKWLHFLKNHLRILIKFSQIWVRLNLHLLLDLSLNTLFLKLSMWVFSNS